MYKRKILLFLILFLFYSDNSISNEFIIVAKIDNKIITNIDVNNETKYLKIINKNLNKLSEKELIKLSKNSLIKEHIKQKEIEKFFKIKENSKLGENLIKENYKNQGFQSKSEFLKFLKTKNLEYDIFKEKLITARLWNTLIYEKYQNKIRINKSDIKKKIEVFHSKKNKRYKVDLSEIIFDLDTSYEEILSYIENYGFENAAIKYSLSNSSSNGGKIGWLNLNNLADNLKKSVINLQQNEITKPIKLPNGNIILKLNSKEEIIEKFNLDKEITNQINYEKNKQLQIFSLIYYNKLKQNTIIYEY